MPPSPPRTASALDTETVASFERLKQQLDELEAEERSEDNWFHGRRVELQDFAKAELEDRSVVSTIASIDHGF